MKKNILLFLVCLLSFSSTYAYSYSSDDRLPSSQTIDGINKLASVDNTLPSTRTTFDFNSGPPTDGGGGGGAIGVPLENGLMSILLIGGIYLLLGLIRRKRATL